MTTTNFVCGTDDGAVWGTSATYNTARTTSVAYGVSGTSASLGQTAGFGCYRIFVLFDTSSIGTTNIVSQVNMKLTAHLDYSDTDFDVTIVKQDWSGQFPLSDANREAAFDGCLAGSADSNIWRNTSGISLNTTYTSGNLDTSYIAREGTTFYSIISARDKAGTQPSGNEFINIYNQEMTTAGYRPVLTVVYAPPPSASNSQAIIFMMERAKRLWDEIGGIYRPRNIGLTNGGII
jgi:hypothetical protein